MPRTARRARTLLAWGLDVLLCLFVCAWLHSEFFGGTRVTLGGVTLSNRDPFRLLMEVAALAVLRWWLPLPPGLVGHLWVRPSSPGETSLGRSSWRVVVLLVLVTRVLVWSAGLWGTLEAVPSGQADRDLALTRAQERPVQYLQGRWDSGWYVTIALEGYTWNSTEPDRQQRVAFYPGYPLLLRGVRAVAEPVLGATGLREAVGDSPGVRLENLGALVSVLLFIAALRMLWHLARSALGESRAWVAVLLAVCWPFSYFFSVPYTEGLYFFGLTGSFYYLSTGRLALAAACGLTVGLTKQMGFLVCLPLILNVVQQARARQVRPGHAALMTALAPAVGATLHWGFLWRTFGDPFVWVTAQQAWEPVHRMARWQSVSSFSEYIDRYPFDAINLTAAIVAAIFVWRNGRWSWSYVVLGMLALATPLYMDVVPLGRMTAPVFPMYLGLASVLSNRTQVVVVLTMALVLQVLAAAAFYGWRPLY